MAGNGSSVKVARMGAYIMYDGTAAVAMAFADTPEKAVELNGRPGVTAVPVENANSEDILRTGVVAMVGLLGGLVEMFRQMQLAARAASAAADIDARQQGRHS